MNNLYLGRAIKIDQNGETKTITVEVPRNNPHLHAISFSTSVYPAQANIIGVDLSGNTSLIDGEIPLSFFHEAIRPEGLEIKKTYTEGDKIKLTIKDNTLEQFASYMVHATFIFLAQ